ncbi:hypothetical protein MAR_000672, partial [Mya arenaria]
KAAQEKRTVTMKVLNKSKELITDKSGATQMAYFNIVCARQDELLHIRVYQRHKFTMARVGMTYKFSSLVKKGDSCWCVSGSSIGYAAPVEVGCYPEHKILLPEEEPATGWKRSLQDAIESPQKSTIVGKIAKVSPLTFRRDRTLAVRSLALKDASGPAVKVTLFEKFATETYNPEAVIEVSGVYQKTYNNRVQLTATSSTTCQVNDETTSAQALTGQQLGCGCLQMLHQHRNCEVPLARQKGNALCPVQAIFNSFQLTAKSSLDDPAFMFMADGQLKAMSSEIFLRRVRTCLTLTGSVPMRYLIIAIGGAEPLSVMQLASLRSQSNYWETGGQIVIRDT